MVIQKNSFAIILILILLAASLHSDPPSWTPIQGTQYSMVVFAEISLYNQPFTCIDSSNIAAAFGPGGESDCRSIASWEPDFDIWYFDIVGNINGEEITFKIYDEFTDLVYNCVETIIFVSDITIGTTSDPFILYSLYAPTNVTVTVDTYTGIPIVSWTAVDGAVSYYIYSGDSPNVDITPGNHADQISDTTWSDFAGSKKFYIVTSSGDSLPDRE